MRLLALIMILFSVQTHIMNAHFLSYDKAAYDAQQEKWEASVQALTQLLVDNPTNAELLYDNGMAAYRQHQWQQAASYFDQAMQSSNRELAALAALQKGNCHVALQELSPALDCYNKAVQLQPDNMHAQHNRDIVQKMLEKSDQQEQEQNPEKNSNDQKQEQKKQEQKNQNNSDDQQQKQNAHGDQQQNNEQLQQNSKNESSSEESGQTDSSKNKQQQDNADDGSHEQGDNQSDTNSEEKNNQNDENASPENDISDTQGSSSKDSSESQESLTNEGENGSQKNQNRNQRDNTQMEQTKQSNQEQKRDAEQPTQEQFEDEKKEKHGNNEKNHETPQADNKADDAFYDKPITVKNQSTSQQPPPSPEKQKQDAWISYILQKQEENDRALNKKMVEARVAGQAGKQDGQHNW